MPPFDFINNLQAVPSDYYNALFGTGSLFSGDAWGGSGPTATPVDGIYNDFSGKLTSGQLKAIAANTYDASIFAGGSPAQAKADAASVTRDYTATYGAPVDLSVSAGTLWGLGAGTLLLLILVAVILHEF